MIILRLVIPAYNEAHRLPQALAELKKYADNLTKKIEIDRITIVNDGSKDKTSAVISEWCELWPIVEKKTFEKNYGKGRAVRVGLERATYLMPDNGWVLVADADGATDWSMIERALLTLEKDSDLFLLMGSRAHPESVISPRQSWLRENMGKTFNFILRKLTGLHYKDTQCGFKFFKLDDRLKALLPELKVDRFSWDAEIILWAQKKGYMIREMPVVWAHRIESHVHVIYDSLEMLYNVFKIARRINKK